MKIEDQVCSQEQSKTMRDLGVSFETEFFHIFDMIEERWDIKHRSELTCSSIFDLKNQWHIYPAYTAAELGFLLPMRTKYNNVLTFYKLSTGFAVKIENGPTFLRVSEAQARADALIWLIENKHINPKELKL